MNLNFIKTVRSQIERDKKTENANTHTPGEWIRTIDGRIESTYYSNNGKECKFSESTHTTCKTICQIETHLGRTTLTEEQKANAELIIAAPAMLKALEEIQHNILKALSLFAQENELTLKEYRNLLGALCEIAQPAIDKATE